ncbi:MAG: hypothetical protein JSR77_12455 [Planctomycetes bacterium]|nr:hypothetical protein [Planctomycetota bacterium]
MICRISGMLERVDDLTATIAPSGGSVAYEVLLPRFLAEQLAAKTGQPVVLITHQYFEGQGQGASFIPRLIGFLSRHQRDFFELFTTVKGIGNRKALRAMAVEPSVIASAIARKDAAALVKLPEIGKRMAETVIAELTGKVDGYLSEGEVRELDMGAVGRGAAGADAMSEDAVQVLVTLGETRPDAERLVLRAIDRAKREGRTLGRPEDVVELVFAARST